MFINLGIIYKYEGGAEKTLMKINFQTCEVTKFTYISSFAVVRIMTDGAAGRAFMPKIVGYCLKKLLFVCLLLVESKTIITDRENRYTNLKTCIIYDTTWILITCIIYDTSR